MFYKVEININYGFQITLLFNVVKPVPPREMGKVPIVILLEASFDKGDTQFIISCFKFKFAIVAYLFINDVEFSNISLPFIFMNIYFRLGLL
jgi:hypothetical protein